MNTSLIRFQPWKGNHYQDGFNGLKTLIVGESVYNWNGSTSEDINSDPDLTIGTIGEQLAGDYTVAFYTKVCTAFLGYSPTLEDKKRFWQQVAYYNYVQESVGDAPRVRPTEAHWAGSEAAFSQVLNDLQPDFVVVLGYENWEHLPFLDGKCGPDLIGAPLSRTYLYRHLGGEALAFAIKHPSTGFSPMNWHQHIMAAVELKKA